MNSEEFSSISGSECDDGRVANCRTLPLFNYTELAPPPVDAEAADDILQDPNCPYVYSPILKKYHRLSANTC